MDKAATGSFLPYGDDIAPLADAARRLWHRCMVCALSCAVVTVSVGGDPCVDILDLRVTEHGPQTRVATVAGEIDTLTAPELATFLTAQLTAVQRVVVDLDGVQFLGSAGLTVLFQASELAAHQGRDLRFVCNSRPANRALETTGLRENLPFADTVPDALAAAL